MKNVFVAILVLTCLRDLLDFTGDAYSEEETYDLFVSSDFFNICSNVKSIRI